MSACCDYHEAQALRKQVAALTAERDEAYQRGYDAGVESLDVEDLTAEVARLRARARAGLSPELPDMWRL